MSRSPRLTERSSNTAPARRSPEAESLKPLTANYQSDGPLRTTSTVLPVTVGLRSSDRGTEQTASGSPMTWRSTGIRSILNPSIEGHQGSSQPTVRSPELHTDVPRPSLPPPTFSPRVRKRGEPQSPTHEQDGHHAGRPGRRILTPKSPSVRSTSLSARRSPSLGHGQVSRAPLRTADGRLYSVEPGDRRDSAIPPLPALPASRAPLPALQTTISGNDNYRHPPSAGGNGFSAAPMQNSQSATHNAPQMPYSQSSISSPYQQSQSLPPQNQPMTSNPESQSGYGSVQGSGSRQGDHYTQQGWMLALDGEHVGVLVDNQQASRMADEKRKRNAGASARFRARRKEKEKEASQTISGLQQELREMAEDRDFYVNERNFYRELFARSNPGPMPLRPSSPQLRRVHGLSSTGHDSDISSDYGRREPTDTAAQRRRTGDFQVSFSAPSPNTVPYNPAYPPASGHAFQYPTSSQPSTYPDRRAAPPPPPPPPPPGSQLPPPRPQGADPYRRDILDRSWNPGK